MQNKTYIHAGYLIDGSGNPPVANRLLVIESGKITAIEPFSTGLGLADSQVTKLAHCMLLPPLVDSHLHLFMSGTTDRVVRDRQLTESCDALNPVISRHVQDLFNHGVLAFRDGGDHGGCGLRYMREIGHPGVTGVMTGRAFHKRGRYGTLIGRSPVENETLAQAYHRCHDDIDQVKLVNSGLNSLKIHGKQTKPQFSGSEIAELVLAAEADGRPVMVHANGVEPVRSAVQAGCRSIEHGYFMGEENLNLMADTGCVWVPTLFTMKAYGLYADPRENQVDSAVVAKNLEDQLRLLQKAREIGVTVALGTDAGSLGVLHGESMVEEMKLFLQAGYTFAETIRCCSCNGSKLLGLDKSGLLEKGAPATFLVARGTPAQLPRKLSYLEGIYIDGEQSPLYRKNPVKEAVASKN